jgi:hypothetical protein
MANTIEVWRAKEFIDAIEVVKSKGSSTNMYTIEIMQDLDFLDSDVKDFE